MSSPPTYNLTSTTLHFTEAETRLFIHLKQFLIDEVPNLTIRAAGGWVRDKLLGKQTDDIDLALDTMTGVQFMQSYIGWMEKNGLPSSKYDVIKMNPDQSKHLETVKTHIEGIEVDIVNLRTDAYTSTSRIPQTQIGTPKQDAFRRDFTINALFYNMSTGLIEDFTECGLRHLYERKLVTPLDPSQTFLDDPLRLLRGIRFASTLGFTLDPYILKAARYPDVRYQLATKVSRERMLTELDKAFSNGSPSRTVDLVCNEANIGDVIFTDPLTRDIPLIPSGVDKIIQRLEATTTLVALHDENSESPIKFLSDLLQVSVSLEVKLRMIYAAILHRCEFDVIKSVLLRGLKSTTKRSNGSALLIKGARLWKIIWTCPIDSIDLQEFSIDVFIDSNFKTLPVLTQLLMRYLKAIYWGPSYILAIAIWPDLKPIAIDFYKERIVLHQFDKFYDLKCPIDGHEVTHILPKAKRQEIKRALDYALQLCLSDCSLFTDSITLSTKMKNRFKRLA